MAKKYDLMYCGLGNGTTVCNRAEEEHGDYKNIAHISDNGKIKYYDTLPEYIKKDIEEHAVRYTVPA